MEIIAGGCGARHAKGFKISRPEGLSNYVILIIKTFGEFRIRGKHYAVTPGHALVLTPHTPYFYENPDGEYIDDWLHFIPAEPDFLQKYSFPANKPFPIGNAEIYTSSIHQILWETSYGHPSFFSQNMDALFLVLLNHLESAYLNKDAKKPPTRYEQQMLLLRLELKNTVTERHSIQEYAAKLGISESYFQRLYRSLFGISFQQDFIQMRIENAKYYIETTDLPLAELAGICGYANEIHFYRQFKKQTGITPAQFRRKSKLE